MNWGRKLVTTGLRAVAGEEESGPWTLWSRACIKQCAGGRGCCDHGHCGLVPAEAVCGKAWGWMMVLRLEGEMSLVY